MIPHVNQATHFYVVKSSENNVTESSEVGAISVHKDFESGLIYFKYKSPGGVIRSDFYTKTSDTKTVKKEYNKTKYKAYKVNISDADDADITDSVLKITYIGEKGDGDSDVSIDYINIAPPNENISVAECVQHFFDKKEDSPLGVFIDNIPLSVYKKQKGKIDYKANFIISAKPRIWRRGIRHFDPIDFSAEISILEDTKYGEFHHESTIYTEEVEGYIEGNGKKIADLEYFYMGERGDHYRNISYPHSIDTEYLVDPSKEYDIITIHTSFTDSNESVQKSERDITIVSSDIKLQTLLDTLFPTQWKSPSRPVLDEESDLRRDG